MASVAAELNEFLMGVETKAYRMAEYAVGNADDAMDIVQDSMLILARKYAQRPSTEWRPLFFRIVQNKIRDCYRRRKSHNKLFAFFARTDDELEHVTERQPAPEHEQPENRTALDASADTIEEAVKALPLRQQQAFLLRNLEGLSVDETAAAMGCSAGSVKTHHSRAVARLRELLGDKYE